MKTKFRIAIATCFILFALVFCAKAATVVIKVSDFPNTATLSGTDLLLIAVPGVTNKNINFSQFRAAIGTNGANLYYITNLFVGTEVVTNLYVTNAYFQDFHGKTTFIENSYITNLYLVSPTSNYFLFNTNIYNNNTIVSNYFFTNVLNQAFVSNAFFTNYFLTNLYLTNLTVTNYYQGNTFLSNYFNTNIYTQSFVSNYYVTNLFTNVQQITTNQFTYNTITNVNFMTVSNAYITNLFISQITTNFVLYSTNIYNTDTTVSNYFTTNVFNNTYMSNFFLTNQVFYVTNLYLTNINVTNYLSYISNTFVSNFFNTNIFVNNSYVSNFYTTNYNPLITVTSNYIYNVAWPLTNATLYGTTTFSPVSGSAAGRIGIFSAGVETISLAASNAAIAGGVFWFKTNSWAGPTNNLPMNLEDQYYIATSDVSVTNLNNLPTAGYSSGVVLSITNSASTNITLRFPASIVIPERTASVTISNGSGGIFSIKYSPVRGTNGVYRQF